MTPNTILLRRNKIILPQKGGPVAAATLATFNANIQGLGYTLSSGVVASLRKHGNLGFAGFAEEVLSTLKTIRGMENYRPMYPNFPTQVMEADEAELYFNAMLHYFSVAVADCGGDPDVIWLPRYRKTRRPTLADENIKLTVLKMGNESDLGKIATSILTSNTSTSPADKADLKWLFQQGHVQSPDAIPNRENAALYCSLLLDAKQEIPAHYVTTATDVLRIATALSDGDISLAENTKFRSFKRSQRRTLLALLEQCKHREEDMLRHAGRWIRLGERLHPGEFKFIYSAKAFVKLRNNVPIETFNSTVEKLLRTGKFVDAAKLFADAGRAGDFARRLDFMLRSVNENKPVARKLVSNLRIEMILNSFEGVIHSVSTPVLLQMTAHFRNRQTLESRVIFPKGNTAKVQVLPPISDSLPATVCMEVAVICENALRQRFSELPSLGRVYVDPDLMGYLVPFSQRSASKSVRTIVRGSRVGFSNLQNTLRFFIWWRDIKDDADFEGRVDLDLSAVMYDADWNMMESVSYMNLRSATYRAYHSGDITSAPKGASEFIDIDMPSVAQAGGRYIAMMVNNFTRQALSVVPEASAGWMLREKPNSGEVYEPKTVVDRLDVTSSANAVMPLIVDVVERKIIWADIAVKGHRGFNNNVRENADTIQVVGRAFTEIRKPTLYDLFSLHASARGQVVNSPEEADTVFSAKDDSLRFDPAKVASEYLTNPTKAVGAKK